MKPRSYGEDPITLMGLLVEVNAKLARILGAELEAVSGISLSWYDVLIRLGRSEEGRLTMTQLASEVLLTSGGVTRLVDRIEEAGYVARQNCPNDRRSVHVVLTPAGRDKLAAATLVHLAGLERHLIEPLDEPDRLSLARALRKLHGTGSICGG